MVNNEPIHLDLNAVFGTINHSDSFSWCGVNWFRSIKESEFDGKRGTDSESIEGDFSFEENGVIVTIFSTVVLQIDGLLRCFEVVVDWVCGVLLLHERNSSVVNVVTWVVGSSIKVRVVDVSNCTSYANSPNWPL